MNQKVNMAEWVDSSARDRMKDSRALEGVGYVRSRWLLSAAVLHLSIN